MARLLIIHHSPTSTVRPLTDAVIDGAHREEIEGVAVTAIDALSFATGTADHTDVLAADGYILITTANFGYMSGALKHMFDSTFLHIGGALDPSGAVGEASGTTAGRPFGLCVHGRYDTGGAVRSVLAITGALGWRQGYDVLEVLGPPDAGDLENAYELGGTIAALLVG